MSVLQESPWYQEIMQQGSRRQLVRVLQRRFGQLPAEVDSALQQQSLDELDHLMDLALEANTLSEFMEALPDETMTK